LTNDIWSLHEHAGLNADVPVGSWRTVDLEAPPFALHGRWRCDFDIRGEWTKRALLLVRGRNG
jgi:hypothetical protein